jgi:alkanesulfonate monooxygenase SsuD/methylene tetrahydromethanopterin reductase-like flavin-dependent oxidoreductase (luciferase family)
MKYGLSIPNFGWFGDINTLVEIGTDVEDYGWDGLFLWDHLLVFKQNDLVVPFVDPWITLTAIACNTKRIRLGPLVTPLPRRRPWKVAREALSLDHLSKGRFILGVGIGSPPETEFDYFGEESDSIIRAQKLDESLDIITGLWSGEPFSHDGIHYHLEEMTFLPKPEQAPRIPIWVGGSVPFKSPFLRAALYDGVVPIHSKWPQRITPQDLEKILGIIQSERGNLDNYNVVVSGETSGTDSQKDTETVTPWIDSGANWWLEDINELRAKFDVLRERIRAGPPRIET